VNVRDVVRSSSIGNNVAEEDLIVAIKNMVGSGSLVLQDPECDVESYRGYLLNPSLSIWLWAVLSTVALSLTAILFTPDTFPLVIIRWLLSSILVLLLPGYVLLQLLFPERKEIDVLERLALSVGLSLALVSLIGLTLNYTPLGIRLIPVTASLSTFTLVFAAAAATKGYLRAKQRSGRFYERS